ncbi:MAG: response regulator transcription factor [Planctomycetes bacterium]|nr:response regulator transcription factor [Planctomycetota bacterium]
MSDLIRIIIVEDNAAYAKSLQDIIELTDTLTYIQHYSKGEDCLKDLQSEHPPQADIILLDLHLPGNNGLTFVPSFQRYAPNSRILVLTQNDDYHTTLEAIRLGVSGYILKDAKLDEIRTAIRDVHQGGCVLDPQLSRFVLKTLTSIPTEKENPLSKREVEVLELLAMGYVKKEVASQLDLSYRAVALYTENIYKKLQVPNVAAAIATAIRKGLI